MLMNFDFLLVFIVSRFPRTQCCGEAECARNNEILVVLFPRTKDEPDGLSPSDLVPALRWFKRCRHTSTSLLINPFRSSDLLPSCKEQLSFGGKGHSGMKVHKAAIASGARTIVLAPFFGSLLGWLGAQCQRATLFTSIMTRLAQRAVPVLANDTAEELAARVLQEVNIQQNQWTHFPINHHPHISNLESMPH
ncbi:unnamed protein product [Dovyalis caffra]|uniref:Uncharacterized protein n=1 Tax=Dovyalis caffra TaxID=77055 RepID=A0AAV1S2U2_9ROSI|nr:unnamed protein product [Dovyalis caffra]